MRRAERPASVSAEQRSRLMARPFVRRAVELSGGSIIEVQRRGNAGEAAGGPAEADDATDVEAESPEVPGGEGAD